MTGLRTDAYGRWAAADDRVLDYVNICESMYDKLPSVGWPFSSTGSMANAVYQPVLAAGSERAMISALSFLWRVGMIQDQWVVRDLILDHLRNYGSHLPEALTAHVINLAVNEPITAKVSPDKLRGVPTPIANAIAGSAARRPK
jgi:hypothetical protein